MNVNQYTTIALESQRFAPYSVPASCYVCQEGNNFDAERCRRCFAPMALARHAATEKVRPKFVAAIGAAGVGKTVFLGMLFDMLTKQNSPFQVLARGAFSIAMQQTTISALSQCRFPDVTPADSEYWNWMHCQVRAPQRRRPMEMVLPDMSGEALLTEIDHRGTYPVVREFLSQCAGVMLLVDSTGLESGEPEQDLSATKILSYLGELDDHRKRGWPNRPVAVVLTKAASAAESCLDAPSEFARRQASGLWQQCQHQFPRHAFFASEVAGACLTRIQPHGRVSVPLRIEPRGVVEPFQWLVDELAKQ